MANHFGKWTRVSRRKPCPVCGKPDHCEVSSDRGGCLVWPDLRDLVRAQLVPAIGRSRGILETGCEVIVLTHEECGLVISDAGMESLNGTSAKVREAMHRLSLAFPNQAYLGKASVSTREIARALGLSQPRVRHTRGPHSQVTVSQRAKHWLLRKP